MHTIRWGSRFTWGAFIAAATVASGVTTLPASAADKMAPAVLKPLIADLLPRAMSGEAGLLTLSHLNQELVARRAGLTVAALLQLLRNDRSLWIDRRGHLFYVEPLQAENTGATGAEPASELPASLADTFKLHSKPQSKTGRSRVIYLDFNGYNLPAGTSWNDGQATIAVPYDTDGNPATFSNTERAWIQRVWQGVAEAYSPFDVDVTTEEPPQGDITRDNAADDRYGTRAVFTDPTNNPVAAKTQGRSIASVGAFDAYDANTAENPESHTYFQPAWVFVAPPRASDGFPGTLSQYIAATTAHEVGHNLGLRHDGDTSNSYYGGHGSGGTSWGPIMGSSANRAVAQWSKGEYPNYSNPGQTNPDDYAVMAINGVLVRDDDFGSTRATAAPLTAALGAGGLYQVAQRGVIESAGDVDYFAFEAGAGSVTLNVSPAEVTPMMDIAASVYDSSGKLLAENNDPDGTGASVTLTVPRGVYYLAIDGVGDTNPLPGYSDYGSIGQYRISGTFTDSDNAPPIAIAKANKTAGNVTLSVQFSAEGSRDPEGTALTYLWDFGDGTPKESKYAPTHSFTSKGTYNVKLTVTDGSGLSGSITLPIQVYGAGGPDSVPDAFSFGGSITNTDFGVLFTSAKVTPTGYDAPAGVAISSGTEGEFSINGGTFQSAPGTILPGQTLQLRHRTSLEGETWTDTTVTVGGVAAKYSNRTAKADTTPDPFTFPDVTNVRWNDQITAGPVTIKGLNPRAPISVANGEYRIDDGPWTSAAGMIDKSTHQVWVRHKSAGGGNKVTTTTLTIGTFSDAFSSTTATLNLGTLMDNQPNQFSFVDQTGVAKSTVITSTGIKPEGYVVSAPISIVGGEYRLTTTGQWKSSNGTLLLGQQVFVRHTSAAVGNTKTHTVLTIGGVSDTFTTTTAP